MKKKLNTIPELVKVAEEILQLLHDRHQTTLEMKLSLRIVGDMVTHVEALMNKEKES